MKKHMIEPRWSLLCELFGFLACLAVAGSFLKSCALYKAIRLISQSKRGIFSWRMPNDGGKR